MNETNKNILLFDGVCNLCNRLVGFIIKRDPAHKFKFASLQSGIGQQLLREKGLDADSLFSVVFIQGDNYFFKSTAALKVLKTIGGVWKFFYFLMIIPRPVRDFFYDIVARYRYRIFGKRTTCMVPTPEIMERFL
jgi:predicted DCC family thiol-disulfide oxidoreductase YuxK